MDSIKRDTMMPDDQYSSKQEKKEKIREMERFFKEADKDGGGDLDETEFINAMGQFYPGHSEEEMRALHMQIDANCDGTVDFNELLDFEMGKHFAAKNQRFDNVFPLPIKIVDGGHHNKIVKIVARLEDKPENNNNKRGPRKYIDEEYLTVTSDAKLKIWTDRFEKQTDETIFVQTDSLPYEHKRRITVNDLVYLKETEEVAVASNEREVRFYEWSLEGLSMRYSIIPEAGEVTALDYWTDGKKSIFTFGDSVGYVFVCVSHHIHTCTLFNPASFSRTKHDSYKRAYMTSLLQKTCPDFSVVKIKVFQDIVASMKYIPTLKEVAICGESATKMALVAANNERTFINYTDPSHKKIFSCIEYCSTTQSLITGGADGVLRSWSTYKPRCTFEMTSRIVPILYMYVKTADDLLLCLHKDQTICVWDLQMRTCSQTISHEPISASIVSAVYYSIQNNELILANTKIGVLIGEGTKLFKDLMSSHRTPLCGAIYHRIFKQVVSVCQRGDVIVWDINTGKDILKFNVSPYKLIASTAMTLNGPQRKLITVCNDGRVRFWNFNTGQELEVLPVAVPTTISGLICTEKLLFLTSTKSNVIYCLELEGKKHICIEHPLIKGGIKTIAVHLNEGCIVTVSSNGHILVWDIESLRVLYFFNNQSPRIQDIVNANFVAKISELPEEKDVHFVKRYERKPVPLSLLKEKTDKLEARDVFKSPILHFLKSRNGHSGLATVIVADEGFINAWALTVKGGLLAKFKAIDGEEAVIMCVDTDPNDQIVMVGDSNGFVYVWNIEHLGDRNFDFDGPFEEIGEWKVNIRPPPLLNKWNAHKGGVTSITCNPSCENYITTGFDCNVTVWTKYEHLVGSFRKDKWEKKDLNPEWKKQSELENEADGQQLYDDQHLRFMQKKKADKKPSLGEEIHAARIECDAFLSWARHYQEQLRILTPTKKAEKVVQPEKVKVCEPRKIRHFMEKKIFQEPPLLRSYSGPTDMEPLTQYGEKHQNLQLKLNVTRRKKPYYPNSKKVEKVETQQLGREVGARLQNARRQYTEILHTDRDSDKPNLQYPIQTQKMYWSHTEKRMEEKQPVLSHEGEVSGMEAQTGHKEAEIPKKKSTSTPSRLKPSKHVGTMSQEDREKLQRFLAGNKKVFRSIRVSDYAKTSDKHTETKMEELAIPPEVTHSKFEVKCLTFPKIPPISQISKTEDHQQIIDTSANVETFRDLIKDCSQFIQEAPKKIWVPPKRSQLTPSTNSQRLPMCLPKIPPINLPSNKVDQHSFAMPKIPLFQHKATTRGMHQTRKAAEGLGEAKSRSEWVCPEPPALARSTNVHISSCSKYSKIPPILPKSKIEGTQMIEMCGVKLDARPPSQPRPNTPLQELQTSKLHGILKAEELE